MSNKFENLDEEYNQEEKFEKTQTQIISESIRKFGQISYISNVPKLFIEQDFDKYMISMILEIDDKEFDNIFLPSKETYIQSKIIQKIISRHYRSKFNEHFKEFQIIIFKQKIKLHFIQNDRLDAEVLVGIPQSFTEFIGKNENQACKNLFYDTFSTPIEFKESSLKINILMYIQKFELKLERDFVILQELGRGDHGSAELVMKNSNKKIYVIKSCPIDEETYKNFQTGSIDQKRSKMNDISREMILPLKLNKYPFIVKHITSWVEEMDQKQKAYILMKYFGGSNLISSDIDKYLYNAVNQNQKNPSLMYITQYLNSFQDDPSNRRPIVFFIDQIIFQTIQAISYVHQQGYSHRDIQANNFLIREGLNYPNQALFIVQIVLCDFGVMGLNKNKSTQIFLSNTAMGSDFMKDENGNLFEQSGDLYRLGQMIEDIIIQIFQLCNQNLSNLDQIAEQFQELKSEIQLIKLMIQQDVNQRHQNAEQLKLSDSYGEFLKNLLFRFPKEQGNNDSKSLQTEQEKKDSKSLQTYIIKMINKNQDKYYEIATELEQLKI